MRVATVFVTASLLLLRVGPQRGVARPERTPLPGRASPTRRRAPASAITSFRCLTKAGCNSGACHGAAAGKNGFTLTLRGYDPDADYDALTRQAAGRRVNKLEPAKSLMLLKPTEAVPHMGGKKFEPESPEYACSRDWIAAGTPGAGERRSELHRTGSHHRARRRSRRRADAADGDARASPTARPKTSRAGRGTHSRRDRRAGGRRGVGDGQGHGETAVNVGYPHRRRSCARRVAVPAPDSGGDVYARARALQLHRRSRARRSCATAHPAVRLASDASSSGARISTRPACCRRRGRCERFLADSAPDKRAALVDRCCKRPEFVDYWAYKWSDLLLVSSRKLGRSNVRAFYRWIRETVAANKPWDRFAYEITTATGRTARTAPPTSSSPPQPDRPRRELHAGVPRDHASRARAATTTRWRSGRRTTTTASRTSSRACTMKEDGGPAQGRHGASCPPPTATILHPRSASRCRRARSTAKPMAPRAASGPPRLPRRVADLAGQPAVRAHGGQSRLGELHRPRPGDADRRPALRRTRPSNERAVRGVDEDFVGARLRPQAR